MHHSESVLSHWKKIWKKDQCDPDDQQFTLAGKVQVTYWLDGDADNGMPGNGTAMTQSHAHIHINKYPTGGGTAYDSSFSWNAYHTASGSWSGMLSVSWPPAVQVQYNGSSGNAWTVAENAVEGWHSFDDNWNAGKQHTAYADVELGAGAVILAEFCIPCIFLGSYSD